MPQNHLYRGEVAHKNKAYPGQHEAIVDPDLWRIVQDRLAANRRARSLAVGAEAPSLLAGLIFDSGGGRSLTGSGRVGPASFAGAAWRGARRRQSHPR